MEPAWPLGGSGRRLLFRVFFFAVFGFLIYQVFLLLTPFLSALAGAATVVVLFQPVHRRIARWTGRPSLSAGLSTVLALVGVILPFLLLGWLLVHEAQDFLPQARTWASEIQRSGEPRLERILPAALMDAVTAADAFFTKWGVDLRDMLARAIDALGRAAADLAKTALGNLFGILLSLVVLVFAVFFFLRDGAKMVHAIVDLLPMESVHKQMVVRRLDETFGAVVRGSILTAGTQGLVAGIGFAIAGVRFSVVLGLATFLCAFVPFVGAAGIWIPTTLWLIAEGMTWQAWFMLCWGILISFVDNILKPLLIAGSTRIPTFLLFLGILGGLRVYGVLGVFIGPMVLGLLASFVGIYREQYHVVTADAPAPAPAQPPSHPI